MNIWKWVDFDRVWCGWLVVCSTHTCTVHLTWLLTTIGMNPMKSMSIFRVIYRNDWDSMVFLCCCIIYNSISCSECKQEEMNDTLWRRSFRGRRRRRRRQYENEKEKNNQQIECYICQLVDCGWMCECLWE